MTGTSRRRVLGPWGSQLIRGALVCATTALLLTSSALAKGPEKHLDDPLQGGRPAPASDLSTFTGTGDRSLTQTTIKLALAGNLETGRHMTSRSLAYLPASQDSGEPDTGGNAETVRRLVAIPHDATPVIAGASLHIPGGRVELDDGRLPSVIAIEDVVQVRRQRLAVVSINLGELDLIGGEHGWSDLEVRVSTDSTSPVVSNAGPFTRPLASSVLNYEPLGEATPLWRPQAASRTIGAVSHCASVADCEELGADILYVVASEFDTSPTPYALGLYHAAYLGLNVAIVSTTDTGIQTSADLHDFIENVYATRSAEHFGDGHLGFVLLIGDAYADDNTTVLIPTYDGYGGQEVASDHYYACVSGDDDFEDVMLGRLSVGNDQELINVVAKIANHTPMPAGEDWWKRTMLVAGLFYTTKDEYVQLFDEYDEIIPDDHTVDRIYRHDFEQDHLCAEAVADAFDDGYLFVNFAGDGWISEWYRTFQTTNIAGLSNGNRLPVVLSMACVTGWFDNTTEVDLTGSYDCLAEQLVNAKKKGAIACLAAPRNSDGGMFRTLTKRIYDAAFHEGCSFLGETFATAKLLHLQDGGNVDYARHFNLFGDPALIYRSENAPAGLPDLTIRPHQVIWDPETVTGGEDLHITVPVFNQSSEPSPGVTVTITGQTEARSYEQTTEITSIPGWGWGEAEFTIPNMTVGEHTITIEADPGGLVAELDESNNVFVRTVYAYPHPQGFPVDLATDLHGPSVARGDDESRIILFDEEARLWAVSASGVVEWQSVVSLDPLDFNLELAATCGDLDSDGDDEIVATRRMGLMAFDHDGGELWNLNTDDVVGCPVLADADADADLDVIVAMKAFWGSGAGIRAYDEHGGAIWTYDMSGRSPAASQLAAGDMNSDGHPDVACIDQNGTLFAISTATVPPVQLWTPVATDGGPGSPLVLGDTDGDGALEIVFGGDTITCVNAEDGSEEWTLPLDSGVVSLALADIDGDARPDVLAGTEAGMFYLVQSGTVQWGVPLSGTPGNSAVVADLHGASGLEVAVSTDAEYLHLLGTDGVEIITPIPIPGGCGTPVLVDLAEDGLSEFVVNSSDGVVHAFEFGALRGSGSLAGRSSAREWDGLGHGPAHSGLYAQPLTGTISSDLLISGRTIVTGDVTVGSDADVLLAPGTTLTFAEDDSSFDVFGTLTAAGTQAEPIAIGIDGDRNDATSWQGLTLKAGSEADLIHCFLTNADVGIRGNDAVIALTDCTLDENALGARFNGGQLVATRTSFSHCDSLGLYLRGGSGTVRDCVFDGNGGGMEIREYASHHVTLSSFTNSAVLSGVIVGKFATATFDSCDISDNAEHGLRISNAVPLVSDCTITGNGQDGVHCRKTSFPHFTRCTISGNRVGVHADTGSSPNLGNDMYPLTGYNSIIDNQMAAVANYNGPENPVFARRNWWGAAPPSGRVFLGYVLWRPFLSSPNGGAPTSVEIDDIPRTFELGQNSPNPFNPVTSLSFAVPAPGGDVEVAVYDLAGRRLTVLAEGHHSAGRYTVTWEGRDDLGHRVASGIYFARMVAPDYISTRKMILLK